MGAILVSERGEFDANKGVEIQNLESSRVGGFRHFRVGRRLMRANKFTRENDVDGISGACMVAIKKELYPCRPAIHKPGGCQGGLDEFKVLPPDKNVDILRVANGRTIDRGNPRGDGIASQDGVGHARGLQSVCGTKQTLSYQFHGIHHALKKVDRVGNRHMHRQ